MPRQVLTRDPATAGSCSWAEIQPIVPTTFITNGDTLELTMNNGTTVSVTITPQFLVDILTSNAAALAPLIADLISPNPANTIQLDGANDGKLFENDAVVV